MSSRVLRAAGAETLYVPVALPVKLIATPPLVALILNAVLMKPSLATK